MVSILQYFVRKPVNKLDLVAGRCQADPYMKEIILLLSEFSNLSDTYLIKFCLLQKLMKSGVKGDKVSINFNDPVRDACHVKRDVFS